MKRIILIFVLLTGCTSNENIKNDNITNLNFSDNLSLEEFKIKLKVYSENSTYPNIDN
tara:strand:- start:856 stop:1029 length:174 start_codon:yes stop_codon:yes gene_type:complete